MKRPSFLKPAVLIIGLAGIIFGGYLSSFLALFKNLVPDTIKYILVCLAPMLGKLRTPLPLAASL